MNCAISSAMAGSWTSSAVTPKPSPHWISGATRCLLLVGEPDPELEAERRRDLVVEERAEALAGDAPDHLADQPAVGGGVVAVRGAGLPHRRLHLERPDHRVPGQRLLEGERGVDVGQAGLVAQQPAHGDVALAGRLELGPVLGDRRVDVELAALGEQVGARRGGALGGGEHQLEACPRCRACRRRRSATPPQRSTTLRPPTYTAVAGAHLAVLARSWRGTRPPPPSKPGSTAPPISVTPSPSSVSVQAGTPRQAARTPSQAERQAPRRPVAGLARPGPPPARSAPRRTGPPTTPAMVAPDGRAVVVAQRAARRPRPASRAPPPTTMHTHDPPDEQQRRWPAGRRAGRTRAGVPTAWNDDTMATAIEREQRHVGERPGAGRGWPPCASLKDSARNAR